MIDSGVISEGFWGGGCETGSPAVYNNVYMHIAEIFPFIRRHFWKL